MNIVGDTGPANVDLVDYFTKQMPLQLAQMAALKEELAKRQGALSAVEDANKLREKAAAELEAAKAEAADLKAAAKTALESAKAKDAKQDEREKALTEREKALEAKVQSETAALTTREKAVSLRESAAMAKDAEITKQAESLKVATEAFDNRVKAFQDKAASIKF